MLIGNDNEFNKAKKLGLLDFELKVLFSLVKAFEPKSFTIIAEEVKKEPEEDVFSPTLSGPSASVVDKLGRKINIWHRPVFYYPKSDGVGVINPHFVVLLGNDLLYDLDEVTERMLSSHEFFTSTMIREVANRLLSRMNKLDLVVFAKKVFSSSDLNDLKNASFFLKPKRLLLVSEEYVDGAIKANLPLDVFVVENFDLNSEKLKDVIRRLV